MASADDQTGLPIGSTLARLHHGLALGVFRVTNPTLPRVALQGSQKDFFAINDWHAAICWFVLGGPWKARLGPHKIGQSPTRRFLTEILSLSAFLCTMKEACRHSCRAPVEVGLWIHNAIGRWAYQAKKEEEEQINVVLFVNEN